MLGPGGGGGGGGGGSDSLRVCGMFLLPFLSHLGEN